jgi:Cu/Ag efflux protein CusF
MHRATKATTLALTVLLSIAAAPLAWAVLGYGRGAILATDWRTMEVRIKDEKDREATWKVARDAKVKFTDKAWENRTPRLEDLQPGMYVHFNFEGNVIQQFDVKDVGQTSRSGSSGTAAPAPGTGTTVSGKVTAVDMKVAQVEIMENQVGRKTYQASDARVLQGIHAGDQVVLVTEMRNGQPVVTQARVANPTRR